METWEIDQDAPELGLRAGELLVLDRSGGVPDVRGRPDRVRRSLFPEFVEFLLGARHREIMAAAAVGRGGPGDELPNRWPIFNYLRRARRGSDATSALFVVRAVRPSSVSRPIQAVSDAHALFELLCQVNKGE